MLKIYEDMALPENAEKMDEMMDDAGEIQQILEYSGFYQLDAKISEVAGGLGLRDIGLDKDVSDFFNSSEQRKQKFFLSRKISLNFKKILHIWLIFDYN